MASKDTSGPGAQRHKRAQSHHVFGATTTKIASSHRRCKSMGTLDIQGLTREDFEALRNRDPFMYFSIPGVRKASISCEEVDFSDAKELCKDATAKEEDDAAAALERGGSETTVRRTSKISFEVDPIFLMAETLDEDADNDRTGASNDDGACEVQVSDDGASSGLGGTSSDIQPVVFSKETFEANPQLMVSILLDEVPLIEEDEIFSDGGIVGDAGQAGLRPDGENRHTTLVS